MTPNNYIGPHLITELISETAQNYSTPNTSRQRILGTMLQETGRLRRCGSLLTRRKITVEYSLVFLCIACLLRCGDIFEVLKLQVSFKIMEIWGKYYLLLGCREHIPLIMEGFARICHRNSFHVSTCPSFFSEYCNSIYSPFWNPRIFDR